MATTTDTSTSSSDKHYRARTFAVNDNRELHRFGMTLRHEGDELAGVIDGMFHEPVEVRGRIEKDSFGEHLMLVHGERGRPNQAKISLVGGLLELAGNDSLVGTFTYTTNGDAPTPSWPIHNCALVRIELREPQGQTPTLIDKAETAVIGVESIDPEKEYYLVDFESKRYLSVEHQGANDYNWAYGGNRYEHDYCKVKFSKNPLEDFARMTITNKDGKLRTLRANSTNPVWSYLLWGDGTQGPGEPVLDIKAERVEGNKFKFFHQRLAVPMWLGFGGTGGGWGVIERDRETPPEFSVVEVPPSS